MHFQKILLVTLTGRNWGVKRSFRCFDFNVVDMNSFCEPPLVYLFPVFRLGLGLGVSQEEADEVVSR